MKILFLLALISGCNFSVVKPHLKLKTLMQEYSVTLEDNDRVHAFTSSLIKESINLLPSQRDPRVLEAETKQGQGWAHAQLKGVKFDKIVLAPYYGLFSYYALQDLKRNNYQEYLPECPLKTKYLMILFHNQASFPIFGCIF